MIALLRPIWLIAAAGAMSLFLLFSYRGFGVVMLAFWLGAMPLAAVGWRWLTRPPAWLIQLLALLGYACLSVLWSPSGRASEALVYVVLLLVGGGLIVHGRMRLELFMWAVFAAVALLMIDAITGNAIRDVLPPANTPFKDAVNTGRGLTLALLLIPPASLISYRTGNWRLGRGLIVLAGLAAASTPVLMNGVILLASLAAMAVTALRPALGLRIVLGVLGLTLVAPFLMAGFIPPVEESLTLTGLPESAVHRLVIWRSVLDAWLTETNMLVGEGARAVDVLSRETGTITLPSGAAAPLVSVHPHNTPMEILYDLGLMGYGLLLAAYAAFARAVLDAPLRRDMAAAIAALITGATVVYALEFSIWSEFVACTIVVSAWALRLARTGRDA